MLSADEIKSKQIIQNALQGSYRAASYDLQISTIISPSGEAADEFTLLPRGMVEVISRERVKIPTDVSGYAMVKTSLCDQGILAINIGILDPGYEGRISSTLINFGKGPRYLRSGDVFLRLTFHDFAPLNTPTATKNVADSDYIADKTAKVKRHFSETFLNLEESVQRLTRPVAQRVFNEWRRLLFFYLPIAAFLVSVMAFFVTLGASYFSSRFATYPKDQITAEVRQAVKQEITSEVQSRDDQSQNVQQRLKLLEQQLVDLQTKLQGKSEKPSKSQ